jgi:hypothetical protein
MEENVVRAELLAKQVQRVLGNQCFCCGEGLIAHCIEYPCGDCVLLCGACIDDALTICDCVDC